MGYSTGPQESGRLAGPLPLSNYLTNMQISLAYSTCPNDTFIFEAIANGRLNHPGMEFNIFLADVEHLNVEAMKARYDVTKLSFHAWLHVADDYKILNAGSALGRGNGPLLVCKENHHPKDLTRSRIAIPGLYTTANLLISLAYPDVKDKHPMVFSEVTDEILSGKADAGVLIHETRFNYRELGLGLIRDLGEFWENYTGHPIPLGCIAVHTRLNNDDRLKIDQLIRLSLEMARNDPKQTIPYMRSLAQEIDPAIVEAHVQTFVNEFSDHLGKEGREAIRELINRAIEAGIIDSVPDDIFVD